MAPKKSTHNSCLIAWHRTLYKILITKSEDSQAGPVTEPGSTLNLGSMFCVRGGISDEIIDSIRHQIRDDLELGGGPEGQRGDTLGS